MIDTRKTRDENNLNMKSFHEKTAIIASQGYVQGQCHQTYCYQETGSHQPPPPNLLRVRESELPCQSDEGYLLTVIFLPHSASFQ